MMKIGHSVLVIFDYYGDDDIEKEKCLLLKGDIITVKKFSKIDFMHKRRDIQSEDKWYVEFNELVGCYYFPNFYMKDDIAGNRINDINKLLDENRKYK